MQIMTFRPPDEIFERLTKEAKKRGFTRNGLLLNIVWDWIEEEDKKKEEQNAESKS